MRLPYRHLALIAFLSSLSSGGWCRAGEADALAIEANILARHLVYPGIIDPVFASATSSQIVGYSRCGDSALWTGSYLAAESFRYKVTQSADALNNIQQAIAGLKALVDVTGTNLLARCMVSASAFYAAGIEGEEAPNGIHTNGGWVWVGNTSRDQYAGAIFGLGTAYDMVDDAGIKSSISDLVTRLIRFLTGNNWSVVMPDGSSSTTFLVRPDQMLALLQVGRHVNPDQFGTYYDVQRALLGDTGTILAPVGVDVVNNDSYFKFNLDYMNFYNLVRLESSSTGGIYREAYSIVRNHTAGHQNAFFDMIDRALNGANAARDAEALALLDQWLLRPRRDPYVDLTKTVPVCGSEACQPIPVPMRVTTDFLWQRDPFQLVGGGQGTIETAGIDYLLPYWMARYFGLTEPFAVTPAAAAGAAVAPGSLASAFGPSLAGTTAQALSQPLPVTLGGVSLTVTDAAGTARSAPLLYVAPGQINFVVPDGTTPGAATFTIAGGAVPLAAGARVQNVAPALFTASGSGTGVAAATAVRIQTANPQLTAPVPVYQCSATGCVSTPIGLGPDTAVYLTLYGTGIRNRSSLGNVKATIGGIPVPVEYAGPQPQFVGLDQVNVALTPNLAGQGESNVVVSVDGQTANTVTVNLK